MAFAAAFSRPSFRFIPPGPVSAWLPARPFPAQVWLAQRPTAPLAAVSACSAAVPGGQLPNKGPAGKEAGGTRGPAQAGAPQKARRRVPGEPPRLNLELRWLFSRSPLALDEDFFTALRIELGQRAWSLEHAIGAPRLPWSPDPGAESDLEKRRARLVAEAHLGLTMVETAPIRFPWLVRNALLARHAGQIGRCLRDLFTHPEAGSLAEELQRLLDALQRRR